MALGLGLLGLAPAAFWSMAPSELSSALRGRLGLSGEMPLSRAELAAMMGQYPDRQ